MNKNIKIILFGLLMCYLSINLAFSATILKEYNINESQLPYSFTESFLLQLQENETLFFNNTNISSQYISLTYPQNYTLGINQTNYTLNVFGSVSDFQILTNTTIEKSIRLTNSMNNVTNDILFRFNIEDIDSGSGSTINNNSQVYEVQITDDGYNVSISTNTLPKTGTLDFHLTGYPNTNGTITYCGEFLTCPSKFQYDNSGQATLQISYNIPYGQAVGTYTRVFAIQSNNTFRQAKIIFNIIEPKYIIEHYVYTDDCFVNKESMIRCVREQQEFDSQRLSDFINQLLKEDISTCPTVNETIKYVMQGEINQTMKILYDNAVRDLNQSRTQNNQLMEELKELRVENSELIAQKDNLQSDSNTLVKQAQDEALRVKLNADKYAKELQEDYDNKKKFWTNFIIISCVVVLFFGYYGYRYVKENWL